MQRSVVVARALRGGTSYAVFEEGNELFGVAGWGETSLAGADDGKGFVGGEMGESFVEGAGEMELGSFRSDAEDGFGEAVDAVGGGFEGLGGGVVGGAGDYHLNRMVGEEGGSQGVGGGEEAVLGGDAGEGFEGFLGKGVVAFVARKSVHANEGDGGDGIGAGRGRILKGLAA